MDVGASDVSGAKDDTFCIPLSESKYGHAAVWPLISGFTKKDGTRNYPVTAMVANLAKPGSYLFVPCFDRFLLADVVRIKCPEKLQLCATTMSSPSSTKWDTSSMDF